MMPPMTTQLPAAFACHDLHSLPELPLDTRITARDLLPLRIMSRNRRRFRLSHILTKRR